MSVEKTGPQYVYVSDGADYKLLAQGVSLVGGTNVEVLGVRIDPDAPADRGKRILRVLDRGLCDRPEPQVFV